MEALKNLYRTLSSNPVLQTALPIVYIVGASILTYLTPRSLIAFLLFLFSLWVVHRSRLLPLAKLGLTAVVVVVVMPIIGLHNKYYLEVATQVGIYAAMSIPSGNEINRTA